jgi:hypothetical protein
VANVLGGKDTVFEANMGIYQAWEAQIQAMEYTFKGDTSRLAEYAEAHEIGFDGLFMPVNLGDAPPIYKLWINGTTISTETVIVFECILNFTKNLRKFPDPLSMISSTSTFVQKYRPFLEGLINKAKYKRILLNKFSSTVSC